MKIGILTYHRTLNYGACLQAVATRITLEKMGHKVYYVDYFPEYHKRTYKVFSLNKFLSLNFKMRTLYLVDSIRCFQFRKQRIGSFEDFFKNYIYPFCKPLSEQFDVIIYGSDQIWRKQSALKAYNPIYFGKNDIPTKKHVAYSASMGILPDNDKDRAAFKELVSHLDKIAVREQDLKELLEGMGYKDVFLTLDPTLLLTSKEWDDIFQTNEEMTEKYVLVYAINKVSFNLNEIRSFANDHNCKIKILSGTATSKDSDEFITTVGPAKFISLIKNAEYIFTSSFHGLAFSILYHKEFFTFYKKNSNRAQTLLDTLDIKGRITNGNKIKDLPQNIDYSKVEELLTEKKQLSKEYLKLVTLN